MSVIVTDTGFSKEQTADADVYVDLAPDTDVATLGANVMASPMIRVEFPSSADGRGFTIAARLRRFGYQGHLRAKGHVLADQYAMARRSGFDDVQIEDALAKRQPEAQWLARANWQAHDYQKRLRG